MVELFSATDNRKRSLIGSLEIYDTWLYISASCIFLPHKFFAEFSVRRQSRKTCISSLYCFPALPVCHPPYICLFSIPRATPAGASKSEYLFWIWVLFLLLLAGAGGRRGLGSMPAWQLGDGGGGRPRKEVEGGATGSPALGEGEWAPWSLLNAGKPMQQLYGGSSYAPKNGRRRGDLGAHRNLGS
jgi:hypothetical protein